jgi:hypothetical protein
MKEEYVCRRLRLFSYLKKCGFNELYSRPDIKNTEFTVWVFKDSRELQDKVKEYYDYVNNL